VRKPRRRPSAAPGVFRQEAVTISTHFVRHA
jgi:hypothetical protein